MGAMLNAKKAGTCTECNTAFKVGEQIYWDAKVKTRAGTSVVCKTLDCFKEQGGVITPSSQSTFNSNPSFSTRTFHKFGNSGFRESEDVAAVIPNSIPSAVVKKSAEKLKEYIVQAEELVKEMYPNLKAGSNTRGQIRSKIVDQLIQIG